MNKKFTIGCLLFLFIYLIFVNSIIWIPGIVEGTVYVKLIITVISIIFISPPLYIIIHALKH